MQFHMGSWNVWKEITSLSVSTQKVQTNASGENNYLLLWLYLSKFFFFLRYSSNQLRFKLAHLSAWLCFEFFAFHIVDFNWSILLNMVELVCLCLW